MAPIPMTLSDLEGHCRVTLNWKVTVAVWNLANVPYLGKYSTHYLWYTRVWRRTWPVVSIAVSKLKDSSRSQAVVYSAKVVMSRKRCKVETLSVQTTNREWHIAHQIAPFFPTTLSDFQGHSSLFKCNFSQPTSVQQKRKFNLIWRVARSLCDCATAELLAVWRTTKQMCWFVSTTNAIFWPSANGLKRYNRE